MGSISVSAPAVAPREPGRLQERLARLPAFAREPAPLDWNRMFTLRGLKTLPLVTAGLEPSERGNANYGALGYGNAINVPSPQAGPVPY